MRRSYEQNKWTAFTLCKVIQWKRQIWQIFRFIQKKNKIFYCDRYRTKKRKKKLWFFFFSFYTSFCFVSFKMCMKQIDAMSKNTFIQSKEEGKQRKSEEKRTKNNKRNEESMKRYRRRCVHFDKWTQNNRLVKHSNNILIFFILIHRRFSLSITNFVCFFFFFNSPTKFVFCFDVFSSFSSYFFLFIFDEIEE